MEQFLISHDLGTSGDKATLFTTDGKLVRSYTASYGVHFFNGNYAEQDPENWWDAVCEATKAVLEGEDAGRVAAMSFSAQMQGCLPVDKHGHPLRDSIIWADQRAVKEAKHLEKELGGDRIYKITGHRISASNSIEKLMWVKKHEPEVYEKTYKMLQAKDYIIQRATGNFVTDYSDASGTQALNLRKLEWSDEILKAAGIDKDKLPELKKSTDVAGYIRERVAGEIGLPAGTPVVCGGGGRACVRSGRGLHPGRGVLPDFWHLGLDRRDDHRALYRRRQDRILLCPCDPGQIYALRHHAGGGKLLLLHPARPLRRSALRGTEPDD